ncbi:MAG: hypothetical protein IPI28_18945 [Candidatus Omnitrophica bacterium]|nr:hypothetical protein [Candidatus Omnitrophota bacterium]
MPGQSNTIQTNRIDFIDNGVVSKSLYLSGGVLSIDGTAIDTGTLNSLTDAHIFVGNASDVPTDVAMSGEATLANTGAVTLGNAAVIGKVLTGYVSGAGTVAATDTILQAINKLNGNAAAISTVANAAAPALLSLNTQTDSYTLVLGDAGKLIIMDKGSANDLTVPLNASVAFSVGTQIAVQQLGAGTTTIVATGGVTLQAQPGLDISAQYGVASLIKVATDTWIVCGSLAA